MQRLGRYELVRRLATGGMAEIFLAKAHGPMGFEKTLVVKRILPHMAEAPSFVAMFLSEARLSAQLNHSNIVQTFDFGEVNGQYFLAMEYVDGPNLRTLLTQAGQQGVVLPAEVCAQIVASACEGLAFAHEFRDPETGLLLGLVHRDISPDNILVSRQGAVKVTDFGIALSAVKTDHTREGVIKGKLAYMPPEQVRAANLDRRADVYALGVVLYELLTGHKPFPGANEASMLEAILFKPMVPPEQHRPDLPEALRLILKRALAGDREQRYPDCVSLEAELEEFILSTGKPVTAQQVALLVAMVVPQLEPVRAAGGAGGPEEPALPPMAPLELDATQLAQHVPDPQGETSPRQEPSSPIPFKPPKGSEEPSD